MTDRRASPPLPGPDDPSPEVLDELLRAFSADVEDHDRLQQVDLDSPEVDELLGVDPVAAPPVEDEVEPAADGETATSEETGDPANERPAGTIVITADEALPDPVYLAAGDPLLNGPPASPIDEGEDASSPSDGPVFIDDAVTGGPAEVLTMGEAATAARIEPRLRERRIAVKRAAGRRRLKWALVVVVLLAIVVAGLAVVGSGLFAIEDVEVEGAVYTDPVALDAVVEELLGTPVLRADAQAAERTLERIPWVEDARVTTRFPHSAKIELRERNPVVAYLAADGAYRVIDADGRVLDVLPNQPLDYLVLDVADGPPVAAGEFAPAGYRAAASLASALTPDMRAETGSVTATSDGSDVRLLLTDGTEVRFGAGQDLVAKLVRFQTWLQLGRDGAVSSVDVSTDEVTTSP